MLESAWRYKDWIRRSMANTWYDPAYQYYYGSLERTPFKMPEDGLTRLFVSAAPAVYGYDSHLLGMIGYTVDPASKSARGLHIVRFPESYGAEQCGVFAVDVLRAVRDVFEAYGLNRLEFNVISGNPAEEHYNRIVRRLGGRVAGTLHSAAVNLDGTLADSVIYEIMREDYMAARRNGGAA